MLAVFTLTLFFSASLLFLVEPLVGKMMLPLLGGTPAVWNTCMVFFQAVLLAGYAYAHATTSWLGPRKQAAVHIAVLGVPLLFFFVTGPLAVNREMFAGHEGNPIPVLLLALTLSVGIPMFVVCTSAPLLQKWFADTDHPSARDPYFLYGASNLGSMLALLGYPLVVERFLSVQTQRYDWAVGYGLLVLFTGVCAYLLWRSRPAALLSAEGPGLRTELVPQSSVLSPQSSIHGGRPKGPKKQSPRITKDAPVERPELRDQPVTLTRRLRWVALSAVPSSLMLGVTTYMTTDIAAIPLLWVLPLALYLLTFIIVFAHISPRAQNAIVWGLLVGAAAAVAYWIPGVFKDPKKADLLIWIVRLGCLAAVIVSFQIWRLNDPQLLHKVMVMVMPLLVLLMVFMMLSKIRPSMVANIGLHLANLFVIAMVCHGELARDRPAPRHLTEYFLLMSIGGVIGGLFNALVAPLIFNAIIEYDLAMVVACLLVPPLGLPRDNWTSRYADLGLTALFLAVGTLLLVLANRNEEGLPKTLPANVWWWALAALILGGGLWLASALGGWGAPPLDPGERPPSHWLDRGLDLALPLALAVLTAGLYWGLWVPGVNNRLKTVANAVFMEPSQFRTVLMFGLPAVLCYTFVERSVRFGLGVGAIVLAAGVSNLAEFPPLFQDRSFFGVLKIKESWHTHDEYAYKYRELMHGTTLHGMQFRQEELRQTPLTYYHRTGPIGMVFDAYNTDPKRPVGLIGLGTGTMACYGLPGQKMTFYDIDPVVKKIAFDTDHYFTYVADARERGVDVDLILGDARLTLKRNDLKGDDRYGILVVDAFSSDAIPIHLITKEALEIYLDKVRPDGVICFHISNRYLDLEPVLAGLAEKGVVAEDGLSGMVMSDGEGNVLGKSASHWVALARSAKVLEPLRQANARRQADNKAWRDGRRKLEALSCWPDNGLGLGAQAAVLAGVLAESGRGRGGEWVKLKSKEEYRQAWEETREKIAPLEAELARLEATNKSDKATEDSRDKEKEVREDLDELRKKARRLERAAKLDPWTDDYSNIIDVFIPFQ
jgi:hypothetical protein